MDPVVVSLFGVGSGPLAPLAGPFLLGSGSGSGGDRWGPNDRRRGGRGDSDDQRPIENVEGPTLDKSGERKQLV
jgi:hypothetical protein